MIPSGETTHHLTDVQVQIARELGMNPKKLGKARQSQTGAVEVSAASRGISTSPSPASAALTGGKRLPTFRRIHPIGQEAANES